VAAFNRRSPADPGRGKAGFTAGTGRIRGTGGRIETLREANSILWTLEFGHFFRRIRHPGRLNSLSRSPGTGLRTHDEG